MTIKFLIFDYFFRLFLHIYRIKDNRIYFLHNYQIIMYIYNKKYFIYIFKLNSLSNLEF